jgi:hypothetical protein
MTVPARVGRQSLLESASHRWGACQLTAYVNHCHPGGWLLARLLNPHTGVATGARVCCLTEQWLTLNTQDEARSRGQDAVGSGWLNDHSASD